MKKITKFSLIAACFLSSMAFSHGSTETTPKSRFERFLARYGYSSLGQKIPSDQQPQTIAAAKPVVQAKASSSQPAAKAATQGAQTTTPKSRFERFLARYGYSSLGQKISSDQQPRVAATDKSVAKTAEVATVQQKQTKTSSSQSAAKAATANAQVANVALGGRITSNSPLFIGTDPHGNKYYFQEMLSLNSQGHCFTNGDFIERASFKKGSANGSKYLYITGHKTYDPRILVDYLSQKIQAMGGLKHDCVFSCGNHELSPYAYKHASGQNPFKIKNCSQLGQELSHLGIKAISTYPQINGWAPSAHVEDLVVLSWVATEYGKKTTKESDGQYKKSVARALATEFQNQCTPHTKGIVILSHEGFKDGAKVVEDIFQHIASLISQGKVKCGKNLGCLVIFGHQHTESIPGKTHGNTVVGGNYWEGQMPMNLRALNTNIKVDYDFPISSTEIIEHTPNGAKRQHHFHIDLNDKWPL